MTTQNFENELVARVFFHQVTPDIQKYFKEHMAGWQGGTLQRPEILWLCLCVMCLRLMDGKKYTDLNLQRKINRKSKQEASVLVAKLAKCLQLKG